MGREKTSFIAIVFGTTALFSTSLFCAGLLCTGLISAHVLAEAPAGAKPKALVESDTFDWGTVAQGTKVSHDFPLKNSGEAELIIQIIVPSCGCTATSTVTDHIPVGGQTAIHVEVDTAGFSGDKQKTVRIFTNDPENPYSTLTLKGAIEPEVSIEPQRLAFPEMVRGELKEPPVLDFIVKIRPGSKAEIKDITTFSKFLTIKDHKDQAGGDKQRKVQVTLNPQVPNGEFRDRVIVNLTGANVAAMNVPVIASIRGKVQLKPSTLSFGVVEGEQGLTKKVRLENLGSEPLNIKRISSDNAAVTAQFNVAKPGKIFDIQVNVDPQKVTKDLRASLTIETDSATDGSLTLAVYGILPPKG